ncbi:MAG TPA: DEAD/DEAH box helicase [Acidimicrobiia bacterium]|nr:DEAD/DEAH box helicase [Acidimicrobiia bacterium]
MEIDEVIARWREDPDREADLVHVEEVPARPGRFAELSLEAVLQLRLQERGIEALYRHQVEAITLIRQRRHVMLAAGTAAGKSLCFQIPILETVLAEPRSSALLVYPTKALAQDQAGSLIRFGLPEARVAIYDGDTPTQERIRVRRQANVVLTNPDMLHIGILPFHQQWADFLHRLRFVVIDETHTLRGIFGSHVAMILRRLRRLASHYGADPTFVLSSATIGNPTQLAQQLTGLEVTVVEGDDSPQGRKQFVLWNPELLPGEDGRRRSAAAEAARLFSDLVMAGRRTITFTRGRKSAELVFRWTKERLDRERGERIAAYRAGYTPAQRRAVEHRLFNGDLLGVVATNALELGIDVGGLDAAIITTFPGTMAAFRQQAGRAGRSQQDSLAVLVAGEDALDQYLTNHPHELFSRPVEAVVVNPGNPLVAEAHAACAAYELPLGLDDREILSDSIEEAANRLVQAGHLRLKEGKLYWARRSRPAPAIDIRGSGGPTYLVVSSGELLGTLEESRVFRDAHVGAVYLHQGDSYLVEELDRAQHQVLVRPADVGYYTQTRQETSLEVLDVAEQASLGRARLHLGKVEVEHQVTAFQRRRLGSRELIDTTYLDLPPSRLITEAVWMTITDPVLAAAALGPDLLGSLHAAEHAGIALLPLMAVCDRWDIGGLSTNWHPASGTATIFIYEGYPGGAGIAPLAFAAGARHWQATLETVRACPCRSGCPSCVQSPKCGNLNEPLSKDGAVQLLGSVLTGPA